MTDAPKGFPVKPVCATCGVLLLLAVIGCFGFVAFVSARIESSEAYRLALEKARASPAVQEAVGQPVEAGAFPTGSLEVDSDGGGRAELKFRLSGPRGRRTVEAVASRSGGQWRCESLRMLGPEGDPVDLLAAESGAGEVADADSDASSDPGAASTPDADATPNADAPPDPGPGAEASPEPGPEPAPDSSPSATSDVEADPTSGGPTEAGSDADEDAERLARVEAAAREYQQTRAARAGLPVERALDLADGVELPLVFVPGGAFEMGSPPEERGRLRDEERHRVEVSSFYMGRTELTVAQWEALTGERVGRLWRGASRARRGEYPAPSITFAEVEVHLRPGLKGVAPDGWRLRLPTEAEWEYACRAQSTTAFPWGDDPSGGKGWGNVCDQVGQEQTPATVDGAFPFSDGHWMPAPVGSFRANAWGLHDMIGNMKEWCEDFYRPDFYAESPTRDPRCSDPGDPPYKRVVRGGGYISGWRDCRSARRASQIPELALDRSGLRLVMVRAE